MTTTTCLDMQWWYMDSENNQVGPFSSNAMAAEYVNGIVGPMTLVRMSGSDWTEIETASPLLSYNGIKDGVSAPRPATMWSYIDTQGNERGPVTGDYIAHHRVEGWFSPGSHVRIWAMGWTSLQLMMHALPIDLYKAKKESLFYNDNSGPPFSDFEMDEYVHLSSPSS